MSDLIREWWAVLMAGVGYIIWQVRLENLARNNRQNLISLEKRLADQRKEDMDNRRRDWADLTSEMKEIRSDIKAILQKL